MALSFIELAVRLGAYAPMSSLIEAAYRVVEEHDLDDRPHGEVWHTSFHASSLPILERSCDRALALGLLNPPDSLDPITPMGRQIMDAGKDAEDRMFGRLHRATQLVSWLGVLLTEPPGSEYQTNFTMHDFWLSGNTDGIHLPPGWNRGHVCDTKGKDNERNHFNEMARGERGPEPEHVAQIQAYINMAHETPYEEWVTLEARMLLDAMGIRLSALEPVETGSLLYFNRARPHLRVEFVIERDKEGWQRATGILQDVRDRFIQGDLPPMPFGGKGWSEDPCAWCALKKHICKPAHQQGLERIEDLDPLARAFDPCWDVMSAREAVLARWETEERKAA